MDTLRGDCPAEIMSPVVAEKQQQGFIPCNGDAKGIFRERRQ